MSKNASLRSTSVFVSFLKSIPALLRRDWRIAIVMLVGFVGIVVVVISSNKLVDDVRAEAKAMGQIVWRSQSALQKYNPDNPSGENNIMDDLIEIQKLNDFVPIVVYGRDPDFFEVRNLMPNDSLVNTDSVVYAKAFKLFNECRSSMDSISINIDGAGDMAVYVGDSNLVKNVTAVRTIEILMFLVFGAGLFFVLRWGFRQQNEAEFHALNKLYAHQIGSPLQSVQGVADRMEYLLMKASASQASPQGESGLVDSLQVKGAVLKQMMDELNGDILRLREVADRLQRQGDGLKIGEPTPLNRDLAKVAEYIRTRTGADVEVVFREPDGEVSAPHDDRLFRWAVENICKNAADAIGRNPGLIAITLRDAGDKAVIEIDDTGKGMSQDTMARIFDAGFTTKGKAGWGVGLALTKRIIESHKGKVFVDKTEIGVGTTFKIILNKNKI